MVTKRAYTSNVRRANIRSGTTLQSSKGYTTYGEGGKVIASYTPTGQPVQESPKEQPVVQKAQVGNVRAGRSQAELRQMVAQEKAKQAVQKGEVAGIIPGTNIGYSQKFDEKYNLEGVPAARKEQETQRVLSVSRTLPVEAGGGYVTITAGGRTTYRDVGDRLVGVGSVSPGIAKPLIEAEASGEADYLRQAQPQGRIITGLESDGSLAGMERRIERLGSWEQASGKRWEQAEEPFKLIPGLGGESYAARLGRDILATPGRLIAGAGEKIMLVGGKLAATGEGLFRTETRKSTLQELGRAGKKTPMAVAKSFDPRDPQGLINIAISLTSIGVLGHSRAVSRQVSPKSAASVKPSAKIVKTTSEGVKLFKEKGSFVNKAGQEMQYKVISSFAKGKSKGAYELRIENSLGKVVKSQKGSINYEMKIMPKGELGRQVQDTYSFKSNVKVSPKHGLSSKQEQAGEVFYLQRSHSILKQLSQYEEKTLGFITSRKVKVNELALLKISKYKQTANILSQTRKEFKPSFFHFKGRKGSQSLSITRTKTSSGVYQPFDYGAWTSSSALLSSASSGTLLSIGGLLVKNVPSTGLFPALGVGGYVSSSRTGSSSKMLPISSVISGSAGVSDINNLVGSESGGTGESKTFITIIEGSGSRGGGSVYQNFLESFNVFPRATSSYVPLVILPPFALPGGGGNGLFWKSRKSAVRPYKYQQSVAAQESVFRRAFGGSAVTRKSKRISGLEIRL